MTGPRALVSIVDDDASLRRSVGNLLRSAGLEAESFASAEDWLAALAVRGRTRCLVLDLRMPRMSGLDLLARLAADPVRPPVVILTAHGDADARARCLQLGAVAFLEKPFRGAALLAAVASALAEP